MRISRDIVEVLGGDDTMVLTVKKRKYKDVFPDEEEKDDSFTRRQKLNDEVQEYSSTVKQYFEGIK